MHEPARSREKHHALVMRHTVETRPWLCPELRLRLATAETSLWRQDEAGARDMGLCEPYWAFCWPGGQALARYLLDHPGIARGKRVLDFGTGCGVQAIAAAMTRGHVLASDIDPLSLAATQINAQLNNVRIDLTGKDWTGTRTNRFDVVVAGDMTYEPNQATEVVAWLRRLSARGTLVLLADPGRGFLPAGAGRQLASYDAPADDDFDGSRLVPTTVLAVER